MVRKLPTAAGRARGVSSAQHAVSKTSLCSVGKAIHQLHPAAGASLAGTARATQQHQAAVAYSGPTSPRLQANRSSAATTLRLRLRAEDCLEEVETRAGDQAAASASDNRTRALRPQARRLMLQSRLHQVCSGTTRDNSKDLEAQLWEVEVEVERRAGAASSAT